MLKPWKLQASEILTYGTRDVGIRHYVLGIYLPWLNKLYIKMMYLSVFSLQRAYHVIFYLARLHYRV